MRTAKLIALPRFKYLRGALLLEGAVSQVGLDQLDLLSQAGSALLQGVDATSQH